MSGRCPVREDAGCDAEQNDLGTWVCGSCGRALDADEVGDIEAFLESGGPDMVQAAHLKHAEGVPTSADLERAFALSAPANDDALTDEDLDVAAARILGWPKREKPSPRAQVDGRDAWWGGASFLPWLGSARFEPSRRIDHAWSVVMHLRRAGAEVCIDGLSPDRGPVWVVQVDDPAFEDPARDVVDVLADGEHAYLRLICVAAIRWARARARARGLR